MWKTAPGAGGCRSDDGTFVSTEILSFFSVSTSAPPQVRPAALVAAGRRRPASVGGTAQLHQPRRRGNGLGDRAVSTSQAPPTSLLCVFVPVNVALLSALIGAAGAPVHSPRPPSSSVDVWCFRTFLRLCTDRSLWPFGRKRLLAEVTQPDHDGACGSGPGPGPPTRSNTPDDPKRARQPSQRSNQTIKAKEILSNAHALRRGRSCVSAVM